ncbi:MAG: DUF420 domain-containing protein [Rhodospirillaceae bacterium]|nr:DUF420 domain-containing protein [Rhodospirillaceae bacterium]
MFDITIIPHINAVINVATLFLLIVARVAIKSGNELTHRKAMIGALTLAVLFLIFYIIYHMNSGLAKFGGEGIVRTIYFTILIVHVVGAASIMVLVPMAAWRGFKAWNDPDARPKHKKIARWAWPVWTFVAGSGFVVYVMALHIWPYQG